MNNNFDDLPMAGLYIHIPFCRSKCFYCDFFSKGEGGETDAYVDALLAEWRLRKVELDEEVKTIYLGGGTPSLMSDKQLHRLIAGIGSYVEINRLQEFTIEANPEDISIGKINTWRGLGINRISIGIQSFNARELSAIGRQHSAEASSLALEALQQSGINYSADLIYGLPGQSIEDWTENLNRLLSFRPPHFSAYLLSYEPGTRLYAMRENGKVSESDEATVCRMYDILCRSAERNGYGHYEISNFALPGMEGRHNSAYWNLTPYLGLGTSAHSFDGFLRRYNPLNIRQYVTETAEGKTVYEIDDETNLNRFNDYVITSLRTRDGFCEDFAETKFGRELTTRFLSNCRMLLPASQPALKRNVTGNIIIPETLWLRSDAIFREIIL
ncbi:MAG: radical SAM family heme chaperone HemW [Muribaculaceae bacterium]